jgi:cytochrome c-type biogenesis protein CcmE
VKKSQVVGLIVILGFAVFGASAMKNAATPYVSFEEALAAKSTVQVKGKLDKGTISVDAKTHALHFELMDESGKHLPVIYRKPEPNNFREAAEVAVVGRFDGKALAADSLLVKCPSKYREK